MRNVRSVVAVLLVALVLPTLAAAQAAESSYPPPPDVAAPPPDAQRTASGLATKVIAEGFGTVHPKLTDFVKVHYTGWTTDGKMFDSSLARGEPALLPLDAVIDGWTEGLQLMVRGEQRRFWVPEGLAYKGQEGKPQGMLVFDVALLEIRPVPPPPEDVAGPPEDARFTTSGLAYKVLEKGEGKRSPSEEATVTVHYTGWTTDGTRFDSSVLRGRPTSFSLTQVIEGWTEGLQLMSEGDRFRFWIPERLAYKGQAGKPPGMLVFDVELISVQEP